MPVIGGNTPTVSVTVPVPTPAPMKKPRPQPQPAPQPVPSDPQSQQQAIPQGLVPPQPQQPEPTAIILPWAPPPPTKRQAMRKMRVHRLARSSPERLAALEKSVQDNPEDESLRHAWADELEQSGDKDRADVVRNGPRSIEVHGRRWFARTHGNTYHTARIVVDGKDVPGVPRQYGYGSQYLWHAADQLEKLGLMKNRKTKHGHDRGLGDWAQHHGIKLIDAVQDVPRQRDLHTDEQLLVPPKERGRGTRRFSRPKKYAATDDPLSFDFDSMGEDQLPREEHQRPAPKEDITGRRRRQILLQMLEAAKKGKYEPSGMTPREVIQDMETPPDVPQGGGDVFMSDPEDEEPEKKARIEYPQRMARATPESTEALFKAVMKSPDDQSLRHTLADELEQVGHPKSVIENLRSPHGLWIGKSPKGLINAIPHVTKDYIAERPYGFEMYHRTSRNSRGDAHRVRASGKMQTWKTRPNEFRLPWKFGMYDNGEVTHRNMQDFLIDDPTQEPT